MPIPMALAATFDPRLARRTARRSRNEAQAQGQRRRLRADREHHAHAARRPHLRVLRRGPVPDGADRRRLDPRRAGRGRDRQRQALRGEQPGGRRRGRRTQSRPGQPVGPPRAEGNRFTVNAIVDERTLREIYLPQFEAAVKQANVGSVMCSYNRASTGPYACENAHLLEDVLEERLGLQGLRAGRLRRRAQHGRVAQRTASTSSPGPAFAYEPALGARGARRRAR